MSTETLAEITQSIREIRETMREDSESLREHRESLLENGKWRAEADRQIIEWKAERAEADRRYDQLMEESRREYNRQAEEYNRNFNELIEQSKETDRRMKETDKRVGSLGSRIGQIVENMVYGDIMSQFRELGYKVSARSQNKEFGEEGTSESGEIDLLLEDGDVAILIEAKTTLKTDHVREHVERLKKYRRYIDSGNSGEKRRYIGAIAGTVVASNVIEFAHSNGLYVIIQSARDVKTVETPEGFKAKEW